jgi:hypothetical protein
MMTSPQSSSSPSSSSELEAADMPEEEEVQRAEYDFRAMDNLSVPYTQVPPPPPKRVVFGGWEADCSPCMQ